MHLKPFPNRAPAEVERLATHARNLHALFCDSELVRVPAVEQVQPNAIGYQRLDCSTSLPAAIRSETLPPQAMERLGQALHRIHNAQLRHLDFTPQNIFVNDKNLILIDSHPPEYLPFSESLFTQPPLQEVTRFLYVLQTSQPLHVSWQRRADFYRLSHNFMSGYGLPTFPILSLCKAVWPAVRETWFVKRQARYSWLRAGLFCGLALLLTLLATRKRPC